MSLFLHLVFLASINCFFYLYVYIFLEISLKFFPFGLFYNSLDSYYFYLVWEDIVNDLDRMGDF